MFALLHLFGDSVDHLLDRLTTYRLVLYSLIAYWLAAIGLSLGHQISYSPHQLVISALWLVLICRIANWVTSRFLNVPANHESDLITGLILFFILTPANNFTDLVMLAGAAGAAMASKYVLSLYGRHVFNPAALGAVVSGIVFHQYASWWVGSKPLLPFVVVGALLILRKMKRFQMTGVFLLVYLVCLGINNNSASFVHFAWAGLTATAVIFFVSVMLDEPLTSPANRGKSMLYAAAVAVPYSLPRLHLAPEQALLIGNSLAFLLEPKRSLILKYLGSHKDAASIFSYYFKPPSDFNFTPGQYMEWTLPGVPLDSRGNRRYLTLSSSPTEKHLAFTIRMPSAASAYKTCLAQLEPGKPILAAQLAGEFTLHNQQNHVAFIAGGVGITPFRSMAKYLLDTKGQVDAKLIYFASQADEFAFTQLFKQAESIGLKTDYVVGRSDSDILQAKLPDAHERVIYVSGPQAFVSAVRRQLLKLGVGNGQIITDFFPGYSN